MSPARGPRSSASRCHSRRVGLHWWSNCDMYVSDVLEVERPELANKEQRKWAAVDAYVQAAKDAATWKDAARGA